MTDKNILLRRDFLKMAFFLVGELAVAGCSEVVKPEPTLVPSQTAKATTTETPTLVPSPTNTATLVPTSTITFTPTPVPFPAEWEGRIDHVETLDDGRIVAIENLTEQQIVIGIEQPIKQVLQWDKTKKEWVDYQPQVIPLFKVKDFKNNFDLNPDSFQIPKEEKIARLNYGTGGHIPLDLRFKRAEPRNEGSWINFFSGTVVASKYFEGKGILLAVATPLPQNDIGLVSTVVQSYNNGELVTFLSLDNPDLVEIRSISVRSPIAVKYIAGCAGELVNDNQQVVLGFKHYDPDGNRYNRKYDALAAVLLGKLPPSELEYYSLFIVDVFGVVLPDEMMKGLS